MASSSSSSSSIKESRAATCQLQWSQLPSDLLEFICAKLTTSIANYVRFRGVCRSWRSAAKSTPFPPQIPSLVLPSVAITRFFLNPVNGRVTPINLPQARGLAFCGSSIGWLVFVDKDIDVSLLNPLTGSTIPLPSSSSTLIGALRLNRFAISYADLSEIPNFFTCYAFMESYPNSPGDCVIAFTTGSSNSLVYCRLGDAKWTRVISSILDKGIASLAYHKGKFFAMDRSGNVSVCDVGGIDPARKFVTVPSLKRHRCCYMMVWGEDLLVVDKVRIRIVDKFEIFKLDTNEDLNLRWEKLQGIGDLKVFLHWESLCSIVGSDASGCRGNTIYSIFKSTAGDGVTEHIQVYDIESGRSELLPHHHYLQSFREKSIWYTPKF